jgi:hypothetical protein
VLFVPPWEIPSVPTRLVNDKQVLLIAKHPAAIVMPLLNVEVALPVCAKFATVSPPAIVEVAVVEVA